MKKNNAGFSLVELIIVVAIMAIAIGIMAPQLFKYVEKTNVSSDFQLADTVRTGVAFAIVDAEVQADVASHPYLAILESEEGMNINEHTEFLNSTCVLKTSLETSFGFPIDEVMGRLKSAHGADADCNVTTHNGIVQVTFTCTDSSGLKDTANNTPDNDITID